MFSTLSNRLFKSKEGIIITSIILGLGLASLFKQTCVGKGCVIVKTLPPDEIQSNIYRFDEKCYKYKAHSSKCEENSIVTE